MRHAHFARLLAEAAVIVGNSSAGVLEAPLYGTPSVDVGTRQRSRGERMWWAPLRRNDVREGISFCSVRRPMPVEPATSDAWASVLELVNRGGST
jgi:hypothetical protein